MTKVLVTGAGGVVGHALLEHLSACSLEAIGLMSRADCNLESMEETRLLFRTVRPTHVYHLAGAVFGVAGNLAFPGDACRRNLLMNVAVVEACRDVGVQKIVAMGSSAMYPDATPQPFREDDAMVGRPHSSEQAYAYAKRALLVLLESYEAQFGTAFAFAIATNMYGPHDRFNTAYGHVIPSLVRKFVDVERNGGTVEIWGDGTPTRDFLYSRDAAVALELLMRDGRGAYNVATGASVPIAEMVSCLQGMFPDTRVIWNTSRPMGQKSRSYDIARLRSLGFCPSHDLERGLRKTIEWYKSNSALVRE